ncbi:MAG: lyase family protein, partial [Eubacteriales bacterium]
MRTEHDDLGEKSVPGHAYYGIHTVRALENFQVSQTKISDIPFYIRAIGIVKKAAAKANMDLGILESNIGKAILAACDEVISGKLNDQFPSDVFQGGGGTSTNMNVNEVIANKALETLGLPKGSYEIIHPNNHINMCQSTNDVIPTAVALTTYWNLLELENAMESIRIVLARKAVEFTDIIKLGRTCLQDAVPLTLGQEFGGYKELINRCLDGIRHVRKLCLEVSLGATAIGTELNTVPGYRQKVISY